MNRCLGVIKGEKVRRLKGEKVKRLRGEEVRRLLVMVNKKGVQFLEPPHIVLQ